MFKKSLTSILIFLFAHNLFAQKIDSLNPQIAKRTEAMFSNAVLSPTESTQIEDTSSVKNPDSLNLKSHNSTSINSKKSAITRQMDSVWLKTGDTLVGFIELDKEKNAFLFSKDTLKNSELSPNEILRFVAFPKTNEAERMDVFSIFDTFYFLETPPEASIRIFTNRIFKTVVDDGPKHYIAKTKYCLFKNDVPYFLNQGRSKEILLFLMNDCKKVMDGFKKREYTLDNFIEAITQYNRCNQ
jgi:hypothetical protein